MSKSKKKTQSPKVPWHARQGDVLVVALDGGKFNPRLKLPSNAKEDTSGKRTVLAYGEVTGHAHAIAPGKARSLKSEDGLDYIVDVKADLLHEEHDPIPFTSLPPEVGTGFVSIIQTEYRPQGLQRVMD